MFRGYEQGEKMGLLDGLFGGKAKGLYKTGMEKAKKRDFAGAIETYTELIELDKAPSDLKSMAKLNRALGYSSMGNYDQAQSDLKQILDNPEAPAKVKTMATVKLDRYKKLLEKKAAVKAEAAAKAAAEKK